LLALSLAGEKMPWLNVHLALPLALLAARALGLALPAAMRRLRRRGASLASWAGAGVAVAAGALLLALSLRTAFGVAYAHPDTPLEPLIYTQTSPQVPALLREIEAFADAGAGRDRLRITVDATDFTWPWAWYLRRFPLAGYRSAQSIGQQPPQEGVLIAANSTLAAYPQLRERFAVERPYRHRWWFPEDYKGTSFGSLLRGLRDGSLVADWIEFYAGGVDEAAIGSIDGAVLFPPWPAAQSPAGGVAP
jgi:predicted membrane-bound mannosyltransferase